MIELLISVITPFALLASLFLVFIIPFWVLDKVRRGRSSL